MAKEIRKTVCIGGVRHNQRFAYPAPAAEFLADHDYALWFGLTFDDELIAFMVHKSLNYVDARLQMNLLGFRLDALRPL